VKHIRHEIGLKKFGENLREIRIKKNFTQERLANTADIEISQISRIERGIINTSLSQVFVIAKALKVDIKELFDFPLDE